MAIRKELNEFCSFIEKSKDRNYKREENEACSRASNWLFDIWNKYALRVPTEFYHDKLIEVGSYLSTQGAHEIALYQCFNHFLVSCYKMPLSVGTSSAKACKESYFSDGLTSKLAIVTCQALLGAFTCKFHMIQKTDPDFVRADSIIKCVDTLKGLQVFMQVIQKYESLHWMLYNCTIICYQMCRKLMSSGNSIKSIEFLVWSAICMETSIPLLAVKFLTWRVTLYTAVCLAYYDSNAGHLAEKFARRSLTKLQELSELEAMSGEPENVTTRLIFQQATVKMAAMVFKRTVFESRKKPKGLLRPKMRNNLKEAAQLVWPRTATEKLLGDMFVGSSAQFLAVLEALTDGRRRCFQTQPPAADTDTEMLDVYAELFFAGKEIIAGGGGLKNQNASGADHSVMAGIRNDKSLVQLAAAGEDGVTLVSIVRFIKLAFCYEQWETFSSLLDSALLYIKKSESESEGDSENKGPELCLALMLVSERVLRSRALKRVHPSTSASATNLPEDRAEVPTATQSSMHAIQASDDLVNLAETVYYCITNPNLFSPSGKDQEFLLDRDMILDACKIVWKRCKAVLSKLQGHNQSDSSVSQKWIHLLQIIHSAFVWCGISSVDPTALAEVSLRLALLMESATETETQTSQDIPNADKSRLSVVSAMSFHQTKNERLAAACEVLSDAINSLCSGRTLKMSFDGTDVSDMMWSRDCSISISQNEAIVRDLHVELLDTHHRIYLKLSKLEQVEVKPQRSSRSSVMTSRSQKQPAQYSKKKLLSLVGGNLVSNALLNAQRANVDFEKNNSSASEALEKAASLLCRSEEEEEKLFHLANADNMPETPVASVVPPPPILLARSNSTMVFKPAPFNPNGTVVSWYRLFGRSSAGPNVKVRLNDYFLQGAGNEVPAGDECIFRVDGLRGNQRYVFAVAAYAADGSLIGNSIGTTSEVIPAHHPMSILNAWSILAEVSHRVGVRHVAKQAADVLWNRFVAPPPESDADTWTTSIRQDFELTLHNLQKDMVSASSQILLRHVVVSMFISVEVAVHQDGLFCNKLCDKGPLLPGQILRLQECEKILIAMELASYLNDASYLVQAVTQCYGLLVPLIQSDVYCTPVIQVLTKCHVALREACGGSRSQRSPMVNNSVHHMIASITYYLSKVFRTFGRPEICLNMIDAGKQLLNPGEQGQVPLPKVLDSNTEPSSVNFTQGKKRGVKPVSLVNPSMSHELTALEERLAELTKERHSADELTGGEDASTVLSYIVTAKPMLAYKEISKFRRRSRYLEYFVHVMHKALHCGMIEPTIEWSQEVIMWLRRRNEGLSVNYTLMSVENGAVVMQGNDPNKYAAVIVSYAQEGPKTKDKKKKMQRKKSRPVVKGLGDEQEELERKALAVLEKHMAEMYRNNIKRKKLRKLSADEMPWRAEFNHLVGLLHLDMLLQKLERRQQYIKGNVLPSKNISLLDNKIWSLDGCNSIVVHPSTVSHKPFNVKTNIAIEADPDDPGQALLISARRAINVLFDTDQTEGPNAQVSPDGSMREAESPRTQRTNSPVSMVSTQTMDPNIAAVQNNVIMETFKICMLSLRRGLVLAHRGKCWTLLQNIARSLLSCISVVLEQSVNIHEPVMTMQDFRRMTWLPMSLASDFLLDMLVCMQEGKSKGWPVDSYAGDIVDEKGGSNLWFDKMMDDSHLFDFPLIKAIILRAIQMLHLECRWEQLVDICLRFTTLTHDRFSETIAPIMIHAQHELVKRTKEYGGENALQLAVNDKGKRVHFNNHNYITASLQMPPLDPDTATHINIGGYIDPAAHDVYGGGKRALALSRVPYDVNNSLWNLHENLKKSRYISRALIHSRKLLGLYLASQYNKKEPRSAQSSAKQGHRGSSVGFVDVETKTQQPFPSSMTHTEFMENDDVETAPFAHLPTVIESYIKTIELLTSHGERDLVGQANHELGNLYLHTGNTKAALLTWNKGLDQIFGVKSAVTQWTALFEDQDDTSQNMLQKLGPWGCLLSIILTCKIGEFTSVDLQFKTNCALLAAELVKALFKLSLPHPTSNVDYMKYEIFPQLVLQNNSKPRKYMPGSTSIFPNVDLFSDQYRGESKQLVSCLHWLSETLVQMQFNLKAFPCICLYQYLATFVCKDLQRSVQCRSIKLTALNNIRAFDVAIDDLCILLYGSKLPHPTDHTYKEPDSVPPNINFNLSQSGEALENLKAMEIIASKRLSANLSQLYGPQLTCEITIQQCKLLTELSECITCMPQRPTMKDLILVTPEAEPVQLPGGSMRKTPRSQASDDVRSTISAMSNASTYKQVKKLFSKRESPMTIPLLKGMLIAVAESLANSMLKPITTSGAKLTPCELWTALQCYMILSKIEQQRQHSTIAASHALKALSLMESSEVFDDLSVKRPRQIRSALKNRIGENRDHRPLTPDTEKQIDNIEQKYRLRLNARLWLQIRLQLCDSLMTQIVGLGKVRSPLTGETGSMNHTFLQLYCAKGLVEAEACNDLEMQAAFLLYGSHVDGLSSEETIKTLEDAVATLDEMPNLSDQGTITLVQGTVAIADLQLQCNKWTSSHAVQEFHNAHAIMLLLTMHHGETIKHSRLYSSTVDTPFRNIYHRNLNILAHIKLRIGHANYFTLTDTSAVEEWQATTEILEQAKSLCEGSAEKDPRLHAEINFELAKVMRALYFMNGCEVSAVQSALQESIKSAHISDMTVSRNGHLELAMLGITLNTDMQNNTSESSNIRSTKQIAMALQTAFSIEEANQSRAMLPGNTTVTTMDFSDDDKAKLPDFVLLDLSTSHKDIPAPVTVDDISIDPVITAVRMESGHFTWIHVLHYRVLLLRKFSSLRISDEKRPPTAESDDSSIDDFYAGNEKQNDQRSQATKTPMFSKYLSIRVSSLHDYLKEHLPAYEETCELPAFDSKAAVLLVQWYRVRHKMALLWCKTDSQECGKLLIQPSDISRLVGQIKALLQKVEIHFGQTMAPVEKARSRNVRQRKSTTTPQLPSQLEDDVKQTLTNIALLFSPDHDIITSLPFLVTVGAVESLVELFTIGCSYTNSNPLYAWLSELLIASME